MTRTTDQKAQTVAVVGLGYVGLPLAEAFAGHLPVTGVDADAVRVEAVQRAPSIPGLTVTGDVAAIESSDFVIIAVPTPVTRSKEPDLSFVRGAAASVGAHLKRGMVVILESTVYPGVTEEVLAPLLEKQSGLRCGEDFKIAYCPERINPGDPEHTIGRSTKVVSGMDDDTTDRVAALYGLIAGSVFRARDIRTAEACKVIENVQRDLNIALVNELSLIFSKMGLDTQAVLEAAATKWNFHSYSPGLVGGHCIPVDPYYLVYRAKELGYHPQVILAGRAINDSMPKHVAEMTVKALNEAGKVIRNSRVLVMGLTYKEDVADTRESPSFDLIRELAEYGVKMYACDPYVTSADAPGGVTLLDSPDEAEELDALVVTVAHADFRRITLEELRRHAGKDPVLVDVRRVYDGPRAEELELRRAGRASHRLRHEPPGSQGSCFPVSGRRDSIGLRARAR
jgi:UDPglucose 6-dehydrogenase/UDP-N-acetyl-D-galactosamine dehydrogenase